MTLPTPCKAAVLLLSAVFSAGAGLNPPRLGCFLDGAGRLQPVMGVAGNFLVAPAEQAPGQSHFFAAACAGAVTLLKMDNSIQWRQGSAVRTWPAPEGPATLGFSQSVANAFACFAASGACVELDSSGNLTSLPGWNDADSQVLGIASPSPGQLFLLVQQATTLKLVSLTSGRITAEVALGDVALPAALLSDGTLVYTDGRSLLFDCAQCRLGLAVVNGGCAAQSLINDHLAGSAASARLLKTSTAAREELVLPASVRALAPLGPGWVELTLTNGMHMALQPGSAHQVVYQLPEVAQ